MGDRTYFLAVSIKQVSPPHSTPLHPYKLIHYPASGITFIYSVVGNEDFWAQIGEVS
ncbi:hypothetical protein [Fischerella thermalis]|uniref:hypothetical protein n=1 Tax=Fischerella thermalis TaxID=372787 RepID=UPI0015E06F10|nr:hypothetical protein [Fischerella thermalis]